MTRGADRDSAPAGAGPLRVAFLGSKALGVAVLERLHALAPDHLVGAVTLDDRADGRSAYDALAASCAARGVPLAVARNRAHSEALLAELAPDLVFVVGWYWLVGPAALARPRLGFVGVHYSRLPSYRGTSPLVWQLINGEREAGFSLFSLTAGMDEGELWAQGAVPIGPEDYVGAVLERLEARVLATLDELVPAMLRGEARPRPQPAGGLSYCAARTPDDGQIDFTRPARECFDFVRAQSRPYPGAFTVHEGERLVVWRARPAELVYHGRPGQVAQLAPDGVYVICGDRRPLVLEEVGFRGEARPAGEVVRSVRVRFPAAPP